MIFSKKETKKKKTNKIKFPVLDTDEFAKQLEANVAKQNEFVEDCEENDVNIENSTVPLVQSSGQNENADEEWKPFDSDENRDYSGLRIKIQNWKIENEENDNGQGIDDDEKKPNCPWGSSSQKPNDFNDEFPVITNTINQNSHQNISEAMLVSSKTIPVDAASTSKSTNVNTKTVTLASSAPKELDTATPASSSGSVPYVAPHKRNKPSEGGIESSSFGSYNRESAIPITSVNYHKPGRSNKAQPNIHDVMEFPDLEMNPNANLVSADKIPNGNNEKFEMPKKSARNETKSERNDINLNNKFTSLSLGNN